MDNRVMLRAADGMETPAYVARPADTPRGAVVVLQEIFGVNAHIRAVADGFARDGFLAVAPSTFHRVAPGIELGYTDADMQQGFALKTAVEALPPPGVMADIQAAVDWAASDCRGQVAVVGYCWGGLLTWRSACMLSGLAAAVPYYGGGMTSEAEAARVPRCPTLAHFAEQDHRSFVEEQFDFLPRHFSKQPSVLDDEAVMLRQRHASPPSRPGTGVCCPVSGQ